MKADATGTLTEQRRAAHGWRTAGPHDRRCDGCTHIGSEIAYKREAPCSLNGYSTKGNAVCGDHLPIVWSRSGRDTSTHPEQPMTRSNPTQPGELLPAIPDTALEGALAELDNPAAYDKRRVISECRVFMGQSAEAMLEAGKRLIELKDHEPHGEFERIVEFDLGLEPRVARRMMTAADKFMGDSMAKRTALSVLPKTKLYELMVMDDDDLDALAEGGTLAGKTLDEIDRMTTRELKAALRKSKADAEQRIAEVQGSLEAARKVSAGRQQKIDALEEELETRRANPPKPDERQQMLRAALDRTLQTAGIDLDAAGAAIDALQRHAAEHGGDPMPYIVGLLMAHETKLHRLRDDFGIPARPEADPAAWIRPHLATQG